MIRTHSQGSGEDLSTLQSHAIDLDLPVFADNQDAALSLQPTVGEESRRAIVRRPIPVSTIDWQTTNVSQFIPLQGLDFLAGAEQLYVQQTVELNDLLSNVESENRYTVKVPHGETLYYASEASSSFERMCFGTSRSFVMKLYDQTQQEAIELRRRLACGACLFWCYLQVLEVWLPHGERVGTVEQQLNLSAPTFFIYNSGHDVIYRIEGPSSCACTSLGKDAHFKVYSSDGMTQVGSINHQWDQVQVAYNLSVHFPNRSVNSKHKALLLGAAFLLEYMYYQNSSFLRCRC